MGLNPSTAYFHIIVHQPSATEITGEVLNRQFSSSTAVVHSASYQTGKANRVAAH